VGSFAGPTTRTTEANTAADATRALLRRETVAVERRAKLMAATVWSPAGVPLGTLKATVKKPLASAR